MVEWSGGRVGGRVRVWVRVGECTKQATFGNGRKVNDGCEMLVVKPEMLGGNEQGPEG